jgi:hypothetical protein
MFHTGANAERVDDLDVQEIVTLNLQRAIQAAIDLAAHLIPTATASLHTRDHRVPRSIRSGRSAQAPGSPLKNPHLASRQDSLSRIAAGEGQGEGSSSRPEGPLGLA